MRVEGGGFEDRYGVGGEGCVVKRKEKRGKEKKKSPSKIQNEETSLLCRLPYLSLTACPFIWRPNVAPLDSRSARRSTMVIS